MTYIYNLSIVTGPREKWRIVKMGKIYLALFAMERAAGFAGQAAASTSVRLANLTYSNREGLFSCPQLELRYDPTYNMGIKEHIKSRWK